MFATLEGTFQAVHDGELDPKIGNALANLARAMVATLSVSKTEYQLLRQAPNLEKLEQRAKVDQTPVEPHRRNGHHDEPLSWESVATDAPMILTISRKLTNDEPLTAEEERYLAENGTE